jgi:hypothetical protein
MCRVTQIAEFCCCYSKWLHTLTTGLESVNSCSHDSWINDFVECRSLLKKLMITHKSSFLEANHHMQLDMSVKSASVMEPQLAVLVSISRLKLRLHFNWFIFVYKIIRIHFTGRGCVISNFRHGHTRFYDAVSWSIVSLLSHSSIFNAADAVLLTVTINHAAGLSVWTIAVGHSKSLIEYSNCDFSWAPLRCYRTRVL